jgi:hypothetical protein
MIDGISTRKRVLKTPFELYEIFYHDNFLAYVWRPKNWLGPQNQKFIVPFDPANNLVVPDNKEDAETWCWFFTLDDACQHLLASAFTNKL